MSRPLRRRYDEARLALTLLTRAPVGQLADDGPTLADARWAYPIVGLAVGALGWTVMHGALGLGLGSLAAAFAALGAMALFTGGLHHDGLADFADGIGGGRDRAHCLEIMRDSRIGAYGVLALVFAVCLGAAALADFETGLPIGAFLLCGAASRLAMLVTLDLLPPARSEGLGRTASSDGGKKAWQPGLILITAMSIGFGAGYWVPLIFIASAAGLIALLAIRRIDGQTGDVLGAVQLCSETAGYLAFAVVLGGG